MRPPVIDGIEEHAQDSDLARAGRIEEPDFLESGPDDREPPVSSRTRRGTIAHKPRRGPSISERLGQGPGCTPQSPRCTSSDTRESLGGFSQRTLLYCDSSRATICYSASSNG